MHQGYAREDMSDYLVHFTRPSADGRRSAYDVMLSILSSGMLEARGSYGLAPDLLGQNAVCLSETPLHLLDEIMGWRGPYGIGFTKKFLRSRGACPIWYLQADSLALTAASSMIEGARRDVDPADLLWRLTPFMEVPSEDPESEGPHMREREWRHLGNLRFAEGDPAFLFIPEELHESARGFFENARYEHLGPAYECLFLDGAWNRGRIQRAFEEWSSGPRLSA